MSAVTQGRRRENGTPLHELEAGDYALSAEGDRVRLCMPDGVHGAVDQRWTITDHGDTLTVSPSIFSNSPHGWHGFLERGVWRQV